MFNSLECLDRAVHIARVFMSQKIKAGDVVVDATMGNGHDTAYLAEAVGPTGKVYAFDVQAQALDKTRQRLQQSGLDQQVELIQDGHENMADYIQEPVKAVVFNLGYLPGSDKSISTHARSTMTAIEKVLPLLQPGGAIFLAIYYGEPTGPQEKDSLLTFTASLDQQRYNVSYLELINQANDPPSLLSIEKRVKSEMGKGAKE